MDRAPRLRFLSRGAIEAIHGASLEVLEKTGVLVKNPDAIEVLEDAGCGVDGQVVKIPQGLVEECLKKAPPSMGLHERDGGGSLSVGGDDVVYNPGSAAI